MRTLNYTVSAPWLHEPWARVQRICKLTLLHTIWNLTGDRCLVCTRALPNHTVEASVFTRRGWERVVSYSNSSLAGRASGQTIASCTRVVIIQSNDTCGVHVLRYGESADALLWTLKITPRSLRWFFYSYTACGDRDSLLSSGFTFTQSPSQLTVWRWACSLEESRGSGRSGWLTPEFGELDCGVRMLRIDWITDCVLVQRVENMRARRVGCVRKASDFDNTSAGAGSAAGRAVTEYRDR